MVTETRKVFALAALIVFMGVATVEMTRGTAQADPSRGAAAYASKRIAGAFRVVRAKSSADFMLIGVAQKGDIPLVGCAEPDVLTGCTVTAYEVASSGTVVEVKRGASSSILTRLARITVAGF